MTTADKLKRAIVRKYGADISQAEAARRLDIPAGNLSELLNGKHEPSLGTLRKLAEGLGCSAASLVGDEAA